MVAIIMIATGKEITIPQKPAKIPPAKTAKILTSAGNWLVLPQTLGAMIQPSIFGQIKQTIMVKINNLVLTTDAMITAKILTNRPPN